MAKEELNKIKKPTGLQPIDYSNAYNYKPLKPLTPDMVDEILKERDFVPEIKKLENYDDLYYLHILDVESVVNFKFLEEFGKEVQDSIKNYNIKIFRRVFVDVCVK